MNKPLEYYNLLNFNPKNTHNYYKELMSSQLNELLEKNASIKEIFHQFHLQNEKILINLSIDLKADTIPLHSHEFYEIIFVLEGSVDYLVGTHPYILQMGDIILIPPGIPHQPLIFEPLNEAYKRFSLWIDAEFLEDMIKKAPDAGLAFSQCKDHQKYLIRTSEPIWRNLRTHFENIYRESSEMRPSWQLCAVTEALNLVAQLSRIYHDNEIIEQVNKDDSMMENILAYINANLSEKITLTTVAKFFHISESKLSHMFQEQMGVSFYQCIIQIRLISVKNAILQGLSLKEASERYGFSEYSSFYRSFKKEYGISPKEYFKLQQQIRR